MRTLALACAAVALSACGTVSLTDARPCLGALIASSATDINTALAVARVTPACTILTAELLQVAISQALAARGR